ncbi:MAG: cytochrome P450 [Pseudomonadota bacterium]
MLTMIPAEAYQDPIVTQKIGPVRWHVLSSPEAFKHVFSEQMANYPKAPIMRRMLGPYLGRSLFMAEGQDWKAQRQALGPAFRPAAVQTMATAMLRVANDTADRIGRLGEDGFSVPISFQMRVLAMDMVRHTMFNGLAEAVQIRRGSHEDPDPDELGAYRADLQSDLDGFLQDFGRPGIAELLNLPSWMTPWRYLKSPPTAEARSLIDRLVAERRTSAQAEGDMLDVLLGLKMPGTGRPLSDVEIRDNLLTFIVTGSDTTALALTWSIYVLTQLPEWASLLRQEADAAVADANLTKADALPLTRAFLDEVLRLFPSAPLLVRKARSADRICGADVRKGDLILAPIYTLHRHPKVWDDPLLFDPGRFVDPKSKAGHRYLPFGAGPKSCIGAGFALMEARIALATFVRHLDFELQRGWDVQPLLMLTLKPDGGLPAIIKRRWYGCTITKDRHNPTPKRTNRQSAAHPVDEAV